MTLPTETILEAVGHTPLIRLARIAPDLPPAVEVWAKCEWMNPGGSVKDRAGLHMIADALESGALSAGQRIIDATSGNTGIALAMVGAVLGIPVTLVMPSNVSRARKRAVAAYGAEVIYSDPLEGTDGAIRRCDQIVAAEPARWFRPDQYGNPSNPDAHYRTTGPEIVEQTQGRVTHFVAGIGTSGTVVGTSRYLREHVPGVTCIAAEPADAFHGLEGWKHMASAIVPAIWDRDCVDEVTPVRTEDGWDMAERLLQTEGIFVGHGSGAAVWAALHVARRLSAGVVVTVLPDSGERYLEVDS